MSLGMPFSVATAHTGVMWLTHSFRYITVPPVHVDPKNIYLYSFVHRFYMTVYDYCSQLYWRACYNTVLQSRS